MSWLKTISPMVLHQGSDLPYAILEDGVHLCYGNLYYDHDPDKTDYFISFRTTRNSMIQQSSNYYRFKQFPKVIPFSDIIRLNDSIIDGRLLKCAVEKQDEPTSAIVFRPSYLRTLDDNEFQGFVDTLEAAPFDIDSLLSRCMDNHELLEKILNKFEANATKYLEDIEKSVEAADAEQVGRMAHSLKGVAANLSAEALRKVAFEIEQIAKLGDLANVGQCLEKLRNEINRCLEYLPDMVT